MIKKIFLLLIIFSLIFMFTGCLEDGGRKQGSVTFDGFDDLEGKIVVEYVIEEIGTTSVVNGWITNLTYEDLTYAELTITTPEDEGVRGFNFLDEFEDEEFSIFFSDKDLTAGDLHFHISVEY